MSLRAFHIFFIVTSSTLAMGGGVWVLLQHQPVALAVVWFACGFLLDLYLVWFIRKSKGLNGS